VQLDNHAVSYWNMDGRKGFDLLHPFLFSWNSSESRSEWSALLFFGAERDRKKGSREHEMLLYNYETTEAGYRELGLLPLDILFHYEREPSGEMEHSALWSLLYSYKSRPEEKGGKTKLALGPLGLLYKQKSRQSGFRNSTLFGLLHSYKSSPDEKDLAIGPFGLVFSHESDPGDHLSHSSIWSLLYSYDSCPDTAEFSLGPFGFPLSLTSTEESFKMRLCWILGYRTEPDSFKFDLLGIPLLKSSTETLPTLPQGE